MFENPLLISLSLELDELSIYNSCSLLIFLPRLNLHLCLWIGQWAARVCYRQPHETLNHTTHSIIHSLWKYGRLFGKWTEPSEKRISHFRGVDWKHWEGNWGEQQRKSSRNTETVHNRRRYHRREADDSERSYLEPPKETIKHKT